MQILVTEEKHGTYYYDASNEEALARSALGILTERWKQGYWYHDPEVLDKETREWRPEVMIDGLLGDLWPGWEAPIEEKRAAIAKYQEQLKEKYGDDPEVLALKTKKLKTAIDEYQHRQSYRNWYRKAKRVVEEQDLSMVTVGRGKYERQEPLAWQLLSERSDHEYERVELEDLRSFDENGKEKDDE